MSSKKKRSKTPLISEEKFKGLEKYAIIGSILLSIFLLGGGIYDLKYRPAGVVYDNMGNMYSVYPGYDAQTMNESMTAMVMYGLGISGLFLCYKGTEILYDRSRANLYFSGGLILIFVGILGNYQLLNIKFGYFEDLLRFMKQLLMIS